jgi:hypothetical protein
MWCEYFPDESIDDDRFSSNDELKYSLRSVFMYADWVRKIFIVSNCDPPAWLHGNEKIQWVYHEQIYPDFTCLPVFNSHSIESCLHRIEDLSENFIYFNDDVFLNQPCNKEDFFDDLGRSLSFYEPYGMVVGIRREDTPSYMLAALNSADLIQNYFGIYPRKLLKHVPHALKKSVLTEIEFTFNDSVEKVRRAKVRSEMDISITSFLYHHYSYLLGKSLPASCRYALVRAKNHKKVYSQPAKYKFLCINDGGGDSSNLSYKMASKSFMEKRYPVFPPWERPSVPECKDKDWIQSSSIPFRYDAA